MNRWWVVYFLGVLAPMIFKYAYFMLNQPPVTEHGKQSLLILTLKFFFNDPNAATKTVLTFAGEWLIGAMYVDRLPLPFGDMFEMPQHIALSFFLGAAAEMFIVPPLIGYFVNKFGPVPKSVSAVMGGGGE